MRRPTFPLPGTRQLILPCALAAAMTLSACGGSSTKSTATSASVGQTTAAAVATTAAATTSAATSAASGTVAATSAATTGATVAATVAATSAATAAATTAATAAATAAASAVATTSGSSSGGSVVTSAFLKEFADAWSKVKSYKATLNEYESGSTTPDLTGTIETVLPNTSHTVITSSGQSFETISLDGKSYIKLAGVWQEEPDVAGLATPESGSDIVSSLTTPESTGEKITKTGEDTVDGVATDVYQDKSDDGTITTIWIGQKDHLPRKAVTMGTDGTRTEVDFSDYNANFDIKAPI